MFLRLPTVPGRVRVGQHDADPDELPRDIKAIIYSSALLFFSASVFELLKAMVDPSWMKVYTAAQLMLVFFAMASIGNFWLSEMWEEVADMPGMFTVIMIHIAALLPSVLRLALLFAVIAWLLPRFTASPVSLQSQGLDGGHLAECFAGKWFPSSPNALHAILCKGHDIARLRYSAGAYHIENVDETSYQVTIFDGFFYFLAGDQARYQDGKERCAKFQTSIVSIISAAENEVVRQLCGERECWINVDYSPLPGMSSTWNGTSQSRPPAFPDFEKSAKGNIGDRESAVIFTNWSPAEHSENHREGYKACMNSMKACLGRLYAYGVKAHESFKTRVSIGAGVAEMMNFATPICLLSKTRKLVLNAESPEELKIYESIRWFETGSSYFTICQLMVVIFSLIMLFTGYYGRQTSDIGFRPGGPVLCVAHSKHLGFHSEGACQDDFNRKLACFLFSIGLLLALQMHLRKVAVRRTAKHRGFGRACSGPYSTLPRVIGASAIAENDIPSRALRNHIDVPAVLAQVREQMCQPAETAYAALVVPGTSSTLSPFQLLQFLRLYVPDLGPQQMQAIWQIADRDGDGSIDLDDFRRLFTPV
eukprot:TRINITY_DN23523_c0_g1_i1.p1 TRINITY_DN23523_c0_g1~~TRINITY_DN23523_c0_g1_i1.p1  ORF type:complete len:592 (-),score=69.56 TRINITY_DN23523_c0_g1_i1:141-1916(-)